MEKSELREEIARLIIKNKILKQAEMNPVISILYNSKENKYHPILFLNHFLPGGIDGNRYKSKMHHTKGFSDREDAIKSIKNEFSSVVKDNFGEPKLSLSKEIVWNGEGVPVITTIFAEVDGEMMPLF